MIPRWKAVAVADGKVWVDPIAVTMLRVKLHDLDDSGTPHRLTMHVAGGGEVYVGSYPTEGAAIERADTIRKGLAE